MDYKKTKSMIYVLCKMRDGLEFCFQRLDNLPFLYLVLMGQDIGLGADINLTTKILKKAVST